MQIDLSQLFITMPACYGKLDQGVNYTIQQVLDYIDELGIRFPKWKPNVNSFRMKFRI